MATAKVIDGTAAAKFLLSIFSLEIPLTLFPGLYAMTLQVESNPSSQRTLDFLLH
jgi:hypothetical protein